jgi:hypothetical protein
MEDNRANLQRPNRPSGPRQTFLTLKTSASRPPGRGNPARRVPALKAYGRGTRPGRLPPPGSRRQGYHCSRCGRLSTGTGPGGRDSPVAASSARSVLTSECTRNRAINFRNSNERTNVETTKRRGLNLEHVTSIRLNAAF